MLTNNLDGSVSGGIIVEGGEGGVVGQWRRLSPVRKAEATRLQLRKVEKEGRRYTNCVEKELVIQRACSGKNAK